MSLTLILTNDAIFLDRDKRFIRIETLNSLETWAAIHNEDEFTEAAKFIGQQVLNKVKEIINESNVS